MRYARDNKDGTVSVGELNQLYPNCSFPKSGPDAAWQSENDCYRLGSPPYNPNTEKQVTADPYIVDGIAYTMMVVPLTAEELTDKQASDQSTALRTARQVFESEVASVRRTYSESEIASWPVQLSEARAFNADQTAFTPFLDAVIAESGEDKVALVNSVLAKAADYATIVGTALGKKRKNTNNQS